MVSPEFVGGDTIVGQVLAEADNKLSSQVVSDLVGWAAKKIFPSFPIISINVNDI